MSEASRDVIYIPTCWPCERQKAFKTRSQLDKSNIDQDSTDIWTKSVIQKYEGRLADFAAWYAPRSTGSSRNAEDGEELIADTNDLSSNNISRTSYRIREFSKVIRFRSYDITVVNNFKREMVTLFVPFRSEQVDILDRNKFLRIYDERIEMISSKRSEYESDLNMEQLSEEMRLLGTPETDSTAVALDERDNFVRGVLEDGQSENIDDVENLNSTAIRTVPSIRTRINIMSKEDYCNIVRTTNRRQREIILEVIHRLSLTTEPPIQIFFTGPAGCGKTYVLKLIMENYNRYSRENSLNNAYLACASTGKAAVNLGGTTVHSLLHLT